MNAAPLYAAQIISPPGNTDFVDAACIACCGAALLAILFLVVCGLVEHRRTQAGKPEFSLLPYIFGSVLLGAGLIGTLVLGVVSVVVGSVRVDLDATTSLIEDTYDITAVETARDSKVGEDSLCKPVSLDSPEFVGIADGQKVTFRVGVPDCETPDPQIVITETTGHAIDVDELKKGTGS